VGSRGVSGGVAGRGGVDDGAGLELDRSGVAKPGVFFFFRLLLNVSDGHIRHSL
jgi:hypothetical protein